MKGREPELWVVSECEVGGVVVKGWIDTQVVGLVRPLPQRAIDALRYVVQDATVRGVTDKQHLVWKRRRRDDDSDDGDDGDGDNVLCLKAQCLTLRRKASIMITHT